MTNWYLMHYPEELDKLKPLVEDKMKNALPL